MRLFLVQRAQEGPHSQGDGKRQHYVGNKDPRKQPQPDAGGHDQAGIEPDPPVERPDSKRSCEQAQPDGRQRYRNARCPVVNSENLVRAGDQPIDKRRLFQVDDAVEASGNLVARRDHVACNLRLHCIHVIHQRWRRYDATQVNSTGKQQDR